MCPAMTQQEFEAILSDDTKEIAEDIVWRDGECEMAKTFNIEVDSDLGHPISVNGWYNPSTGKLSYAIIHRVVGRIYGLDLGADHRNPDGGHVGEKHKHRWTERSRDKHTYVPEDISETWDRPVEVWKQFCAEANLRHSGEIDQPEVQREWPL